MKKQTKTTPDGKVIEETTHENGTKSVKINVTTVDVPVTDEVTAQAKKVIEERILPELGVRDVTVSVIHKASNSFVSQKINLAYFQTFVKACFDGYPEQPGVPKDVNDFLVVIHDGATVQVVTLEII